MGANKTYQQKGDRRRMLGESDEFRRLRHAVEKAAGDRERAICMARAEHEVGREIVLRLPVAEHNVSDFKIEAVEQEDSL